MRKKRTGLWLLLFILVCGALVYFYFRYSRQALLPEASASVSTDGQAVFLPEGFLVPGQSPAFYDTGGKVLSAAQAGLAGRSWENVRQRDTWLLTGDGGLYDGSALPIRLTCRAEEGLVISDFLPLKGNAFLLYVTYLDEAPSVEWVSPGQEPAVLHMEQALTYLGMDCTSEGEASMLFLDVSGASPRTQILHCRDGEITGSLTLAHALYYDLYRLPSHILLVGTHQIVCYNVEDGQALWSVALSGAVTPLILQDGDRILCYLDETVQKIGGNALWVEADGGYTAEDFPSGLNALIVYRDMLAAAQNQSNLLVLHKNGSVAAQTDPGTDIKELYWPSSAPQQLMALTGSGRVLIFGTP
jgi:hypothetical protein